MEIIDNVSGVIQDFVAEKGKAAIGAIAALFVLIIALVALLFAQCSQANNKDIIKISDSPVSAESLFMPRSQAMEDGYYLSRPQNLSWDEEEVDRWFEEPDESRIRDLSKSNDSLVEGILGAVQ
jgi:hypothetical protein